MTPTGQDSSAGPGPKAPSRFGALALPLGAALILVVVALVYKSFILAQPGLAYPSGSDTWGHLFKARFLLDELRRGDLYPVLLPWWYNGLELFRYWSPFPVYVLAVLAKLAGDLFVGGAWLVPLAAAFGGLSWLLYSRRIGWTAAILAGIIWTVWPDHIYLALLEGNLPRVVGTALFPLAFLLFLDALELKRWPWSGVGVVILVQLEVLCHAMTAAMTCVAFTGFAVVYWLFSGIERRDVVRGVALLALGVLTSVWWLLPSLSGGFVAMSPAALRGLAPTVGGVFTPSDQRGFLVGLLSLGVVFMAALTWRSRSALGRAATVCALGGVLLTVPWVIPVYLLLPYSYLMWPTRYTGLNAVPVVLAFAAWASVARPNFRNWPTYLMLAGAAAALLTGVGSTRGLLFGQVRADQDAIRLAEELARRPGWRVAQFTPPAQMAYQTAVIGGREQVYGFAWQGAKTAPELVLMDEAIKQGNYAFAIDRAWQSGATDLVVRQEAGSRESFIQAAAACGFGQRAAFGSYVLVSREAGPQAFVNSYRVLAVGATAGISATLFPQIEIGRPILDSYTVDELARYDTVLLTGVEWKSKARSEALVEEYVKRGGQVVVDLTKFPADVLSGQPSFLGVRAIPVELAEIPTVEYGAGTIEFGSLPTDYRPWLTHFVQGLDEVDASFSYYGQSAGVLGSKRIGGRVVTYVALNLPYHAYLTHDPAALAVLEGVLGLEAWATPAREALPLRAYRATSQGWTFALDVPARAAGQMLILPFPALDSLSAFVDGEKVEVVSVENLVGLNASTGTHSLDLEVGLPPLTPVAALASLAAMVLVIAYALTQSLIRRRGKKVGVGNEGETARPL